MSFVNLLLIFGVFRFTVYIFRLVPAPSAPGGAWLGRGGLARLPWSRPPPRALDALAQGDIRRRPGARKRAPPRACVLVRTYLHSYQVVAD